MAEPVAPPVLPPPQNVEPVQEASPAPSSPENQNELGNTPTENGAPSEKYKIESISGFDVLKVKIEGPTESIYVKYDGQMVIDNSLKMEAVTGSKKGIFSGLWASASTGSVFINRIFLDTAAAATAAGQSAIIHISGIFPGSITEIDIQPGEKWLVASHSFLACTGDVNITTRANFNIVKFVSGLDLFFTELSVDANKPPGKFWITSFGGTYKKELNETTKKCRINPGLFMAAREDIATALTTVGAGSLGAIFATGQFLMMDFSKCPDGTVYLQTTNESYMIYKLTNKVNDANATIDITTDLLLNSANEGGGGGEGGDNSMSEYTEDNEAGKITPMSSSFEDLQKLNEVLGGGGRKKRHTRRLGALRRSHTKRRIYF